MTPRLLVHLEGCRLDSWGWWWGRSEERPGNELKVKYKGRFWKNQEKQLTCTTSGNSIQFGRRTPTTSPLVKPRPLKELDTLKESSFTCSDHMMLQFMQNWKWSTKNEKELMDLSMEKCATSYSANKAWHRPRWAKKFEARGVKDGWCHHCTKGRLRIHKGGLRGDDWDCEIDDDDEEKVRHLEGARA